MEKENFIEFQVINDKNNLINTFLTLQDILQNLLSSFNINPSIDRNKFYYLYYLNEHNKKINLFSNSDYKRFIELKKVICSFNPSNKIYISYNNNCDEEKNKIHKLEKLNYVLQKENLHIKDLNNLYKNKLNLSILNEKNLVDEIKNIKKENQSFKEKAEMSSIILDRNVSIINFNIPNEEEILNQSVIDKEIKRKKNKEKNFEISQFFKYGNNAVKNTKKKDNNLKNIEKKEKEKFDGEINKSRIELKSKEQINNEKNRLIKKINDFLKNDCGINEIE